MSQKNIRLSAIIIAKNEEPRIGICLDALAFADEVIVVDNHSSDKTADIARKKGARVEHAAASDFAALRTEALAYTSADWVLYVDADEIITPELAKEIISTINSSHPYAGYYIHRKNWYLGVLWPKREKMIRLMRKEKFVRWEGALHETAVINGDIGDIHKGFMDHDTHRTLSEMVIKTNEWSHMEALLRYRAHHPRVSWWRVIRVMGTGFWNSFVRDGGWRVGIVGWIESMYQGFSMFITYAKLWEMQNKNPGGLSHKKT